MNTRTAINEAVTEMLENDNLFVCCICGDEHHIDDRFTHDGEEYCTSCFNDRFTYCCCCDDVIEIDGNDHYIFNDNDYCERCYYDEVATCCCCGDEGFESDMTEFEGSYYCERCFNDTFGYCDRCGEYHNRDCMTYDEETERDYCDYCYQIVMNERVGELRQYSYKPDPIFHALPSQRQKHYFGIELESSFGNNRLRTETLGNVVDIVGKDEDLFYFKKDTSLVTGFEMVSHPCTLQYWHSKKETLEKVLKAISKNVIEGREDDGYHIHIARKAMSKMHKKRFEAFFDMCKEQITIFARRNDNGYFRFNAFPKTGKLAKELGKKDERIGRYKTVNWCNSATVEIRCFKATTDIVTFFACLELCHAIYQFTKQCSIVDVVDNNECCKVWTKFITFIRNDKRYQNAYRFWLMETSH